MTHAIPPPLKVPMTSNKEVTNFYRDLTKSLYLLWEKCGGGGPMEIESGGTGGETSAEVLTNLGLSTTDSPLFAGVSFGDADTTLTRASAGNVNVEGNLVYRAAGTDVPVTDGGTGASDATTARSNLGVTAANLGLGTADTPTFTGVVLTATFTHTGTLGFYGATPVTQSAAYTQTYATASRTHANPTAATLTDSSTGTADQTVSAISGSGADAGINDNFAELTDEVNKLIADVANVKQVLNQAIDDLQANGLLQ